MLKVPSHRVYVSVVRFRQCLITFRQNQHVVGFRKRWPTFDLDWIREMEHLLSSGMWTFLGDRTDPPLKPHLPSILWHLFFRNDSRHVTLMALYRRYVRTLMPKGIFGVSVNHWGPQNETFGCTQHENGLEIPAVHGLLFVIQRHQNGKSIGNIIFIVSWCMKTTGAKKVWHNILKSDHWYEHLVR